jgi:hypothetical protein
MRFNTGRVYFETRASKVLRPTFGHLRTTGVSGAQKKYVHHLGSMLWVYALGLCSGSMLWVHALGPCSGSMLWVHALGP